MTLDFQQVQQQVHQIGEGALAREQLRKSRLEIARKLMSQWNNDFAGLNRQVEQALSREPLVRCARPVDHATSSPEPLRAAFQSASLPERGTILAADGSQISPDRHAEVLYCLINVGAIETVLGSPDPPRTHIKSQLLYDDELYTSHGMISEALLSIMRDRHERAILAQLAKAAHPPVVTFTDGPIELWGAKGSDEEAASFQHNLREYLTALESLCHQQVIVGGYVDKPMSDLVVRLLEIASASPEQLDDLRTFHPLRGITDQELYRELLNPGERSAVFAIQSGSDRHYQGDLALHFFYLNVGRKEKPWVARVEIPAWVVKDHEKLNILHAILVDQCRMMGSRHFPYLLHRAHETAVVTFPEKDQVTQMVALELRRRGVEVGEASQKQEVKASDGRTRFSG